MKAVLDTVMVNEQLYHRKGRKYKIGRHGLIFVWVNNEWIKSTCPKSELIKPIQLKREF